MPTGSVSELTPGLQDGDSSAARSLWGLDFPRWPAWLAKNEAAANTSRTPFFPTEAGTAVRVDAQCDRFEEAWANGEKPRTEDWLDDCSTEARAAPDRTGTSTSADRRPL